MTRTLRNDTDKTRLPTLFAYAPIPPAAKATGPPGAHRWLRPMEAFTLSVPREVARTVSDDIRRMLGYSIHPPFIGAVDGLHPLRLLEQP